MEMESRTEQYRNVMEITIAIYTTEMLGLVECTMTHGINDERRESYNIELLEQILSDSNIDLAIQQVIRNKGSNGVDKMSTMD